MCPSACSDRPCVPGRHMTSLEKGRRSVSLQARHSPLPGSRGCPAPGATCARPGAAAPWGHRSWARAAMFLWPVPLPSPQDMHTHTHMFTLTQTHMLTHAHTPRHTRSHTCSHAHTQRHARTPCSSHTDTHFHTHMFILIHMHTHSHAHLLTCTHVNSCLRHCRDTRVHTPVQPCSHCTHRHARSHSDTRTYKHAHSHTQITSDKKHLRQLCAPSLSLGFLKLNQNRQIIFIFILEFTF